MHQSAQITSTKQTCVKLLLNCKFTKLVLTLWISHDTWERKQINSARGQLQILRTGSSPWTGASLRGCSVWKSSRTTSPWMLTGFKFCLSVTVRQIFIKWTAQWTFSDSGCLVKSGDQQVHSPRPDSVKVQLFNWTETFGFMEKIISRGKICIWMFCELHELQGKSWWLITQNIHLFTGTVLFIQLLIQKPRQSPICGLMLAFNDRNKNSSLLKLTVKVDLFYVAPLLLRLYAMSLNPKLTCKTC